MAVCVSRSSTAGRPMAELAPLITEIAERNRTIFIGRPAQ
jgi:hypothetical protein